MVSSRELKLRALLCGLGSVLVAILSGYTSGQKDDIAYLLIGLPLYAYFAWLMLNLPVRM